MSLFSAISKRKFSNIGTTGFVVITPFIPESCLSKADDETINFINIKYKELLVLKIG